MVTISHVRPSTVAASSSFTPAVRVDDVVYVSGQVSMDGDGRIVGAGDFEAQAEQVFQNLITVLREADAELSNVVKTTAFLIDTEDYAKFNEIRSRYFPTNPPASSTVFVAALVKPELVVELEAVAVTSSEG